MWGSIGESPDPHAGDGREDRRPPLQLSIWGTQHPFEEAVLLF